MRRYRGEALPGGARVAVVSNDAIGNYVVLTPLLQMLRANLRPGRLSYFSGPRTEELWSKDLAIDFGASFLGADARAASRIALEEEPYDLVINVEATSWAKSFSAMLCGEDTLVCGPCAGEGGRSDLEFANDPRGKLWEDPKWIAPDLTSRYPFLESGFIGAIFCRLAYLSGPVPLYTVPSQQPSQAVPDVLIAMSASLADKLWPIESWRVALQFLEARGLSVGLLGAPPSSQRRYWQGDAAERAILDERVALDLRGRFSLPEVVGALGLAQAVLTLDNGILHLAAAARTPTVGLFREGIHRLWAPPAPGLQVLIPNPGEPVSAISPDRVKEAIARAL